MSDLFSNELFYELFEYLTTYNILYAFKGLNKRIDKVLEDMLNTILILNLGENLNLILFANQFDLNKLFYIRQFIDLESLTLIEITEQDLNKVVTKFNLLSKLSYLSIKLAHGLMPKITVLSLKYLSIGTCSISQLEQLLLCTPILTNLNVQLITDTTSADNTFLSVTIRTEICQLKIELAEKSNITLNDIKILKKFTFTAAKGLKFIRGGQWEHLIRTYLPQLKEFHFKIHSHLYHTNIEQLLATFQTSFLLKEHQWFVNCDHHHLPNIGDQNLRNIHLYTLPYSDERYYLSLSTKSVTNVGKDEYSTIKSINNFINLSQIKHLIIKQNNQINSEQFLSYILVQLERLLPNSHMLDNAPKVRNKTSLYRLQN